MMIDIKDRFETQDRWPLRCTKLNAWESQAFDASTGTYYVMLRDADFYSNSAKLERVNGAVATSGHFTVKSGLGSAVIIEYPGLHLLESRYYVQESLDQGNLSYIDGGTNTTAINPGRLGDPVINYVHFPAHMYQTLHTHPSHRIGLILKGNGRVELDHNEFFSVPEGSAFFMRRNTLHNFICDDQDVILLVFAPDSGTGPTDEVNPLKIRTYIGQQRYAR